MKFFNFCVPSVFVRGSCKPIKLLKYSDTSLRPGTLDRLGLACLPAGSSADSRRQIQMLHLQIQGTLERQRLIVNCMSLFLMEHQNQKNILVFLRKPRGEEISTRRSRNIFHSRQERV